MKLGENKPSWKEWAKYQRCIYGLCLDFKDNEIDNIFCRSMKFTKAAHDKKLVENWEDTSFFLDRCIFRLLKDRDITPPDLPVYPLYKREVANELTNDILKEDLPAYNTIKEYESKHGTEHRARPFLIRDGAPLPKSQGKKRTQDSR